MAVFGRKKKAATEKKADDLGEKKLKQEKKNSTKKRKLNKKEKVGSRWAAMGLLLVTILLSLYFWLSGSIGDEALNTNSESVEIKMSLPAFGESTYWLE